MIYRGKLVLRHGKYTAQIYKGMRAAKKQDDEKVFWHCGNVSVAYDVVEMLENLGHTVEIIDDSDDLDES